MTLREEFLGALVKQLADEGKLIEAGWVELRLAAIPADAPDVQIREMRMAFMAGAQHLFGSIFGMLDDGDEATAADERRLDLIRAELDAFIEELKQDERFKGARS